MVHPRSFALSLAALSTATALAAASAGAVTRRVPVEYPTIQAAMDLSVAGDTVLVAPGTYTDVQTRSPTGFATTACVFFGDGVTLRSEGGAGITAIDMASAAGPLPEVLYLLYLPSGTTAVEGFTITGVRTGGHGAITAFGGLITFRDCIFRDMDAGRSSGAAIAANTDLVLERCEFLNCRASGGGAIYHSNGRIWMYSCAIRACGTGAAWLDGAPGAPLESSYIENCTFEDCWGTATGALTISGHHGGVTVRNCRFFRNVGGGSSAGGIGMSGFPATPKLVEGCLFWGNTAAGANGTGGAISTSGPTILRGNTFVENGALVYGGAVYFGSDGTGSVENNIFVGNVADSGAVSRPAVWVTSSCNVFWDNAPGYPASSTDRMVDPLFCDPVAGLFGLRVGSPCLPEGSLGCALIGAFGEDCGTVSVAPSTWGKVKAAYRGGEGE